MWSTNTCFALSFVTYELNQLGSWACQHRLCPRTLMPCASPNATSASPPSKEYVVGVGRIGPTFMEFSATRMLYWSVTIFATPALEASNCASTAAPVSSPCAAAWAFSELRPVMSEAPAEPLACIACANAEDRESARPPETASPFERKRRRVCLVVGFMGSRLSPRMSCNMRSHFLIRFKAHIGRVLDGNSVSDSHSDAARNSLIVRSAAGALGRSPGSSV